MEDKYREAEIKEEIKELKDKIEALKDEEDAAHCCETEDEKDWK